MTGVPYSVRVILSRKVEILNKFLLGCYNKHVPLRKINPKHLPAPWLTNDKKVKKMKGIERGGGGRDRELTPTMQSLEF